ncbi:protein phosphatase [Lithospermum erythrorhizon]|uniref:Protein phosphatase n=1 Tax=Lithospermum erythrorhizon TaxID=34254 RepID=A0AAV3RV37_LITER
MVQISTFFTGLARNLSIRSPRKSYLDAQSDDLDSITKEARNNGLVLTSPCIVDAKSSGSFTSIYSKRGQKGINQDCFVVWEEFGYQEDMIFCGIFDGHGPWGHLVSRKVRKLMPASLLKNWQNVLVQNSLDDEIDFGLEFKRNLLQLDVWKKCFLKTCLSIDEKLNQHPDIDSFYSGTTALSVIRQGDMMIVANVGDSRAVLATTSDEEGILVPIQLTVDFKPNLPLECERIKQSGGRVLSSRDEQGLYRIWMPKGECFNGPGLAVSRAFGDHYIKDFGLISEPDVIQRRITNRDHFVILATDGVWDVISNQEAIDIVASTPERHDAAKRLVKCAACTWKHKRPGIARDDISAICLFFHET